MRASGFGEGAKNRKRTVTGLLLLNQGNRFIKPLPLQRVERVYVANGVQSL